MVKIKTKLTSINDRSDWCLNCSKTSFKKRKTKCNKQFPTCSNCLTKGIKCNYSNQQSLKEQEQEEEEEEEIKSNWSNFNLNQIQHYPSPLYLTQGNIGSANLICKKLNEKNQLKFEWEESVIQNEDLRIKPEPNYSPYLVYPKTIYAEDELETRDRKLDPLSNAFDTTLLNQFHSLAPTTSIHPTILLNAILSNRNKKNQNEGPYPNYGNCLSIVNLSNNNGTEGSSRVIWRSGDEIGRPTKITSGEFINFNNRIGTTSRKGKEREMDIDDDENSNDGTLGTGRRRRNDYYPTFKPDSNPISSTFDSPILQLQTSSLPSSSSSTPSYLCATRTFTTFALLHLSSPSSSSHFLNNQNEEEEETKIINQFQYPFREISKSPIASFILNQNSNLNQSHQLQGMLIDTTGNLFGWGLDNITKGIGGVGSKPEMFRLRKSSREIGEGDGFARVQFGGSRGLDAIVGFRDEVLLYDLRSPKASSTLLSPSLLSRHIPYGRSTSPSIITSLLQSSPTTSLLPSNNLNKGIKIPTSLHLICTDREIIWLDDRMSNKELFSWNHSRAGLNGKGTDDSLEIIQLNCSSSSSLSEQEQGEGEGEEEGIERIILTSKLQTKLSIYTYSSKFNQSPRSLLDPFDLISPVDVNSSKSSIFVRSGLAVVPYSRSQKENENEEEEDERVEREKGKGKDRNGWLIMESGFDGSLYSRFTSLNPKEIDQEEEGELELREEDNNNRRRIWTPKIQILADKMNSIKEQLVVELEGREDVEELLSEINEKKKNKLNEVNLKNIWKDIFGQKEDNKEDKLEEEEEGNGNENGQSEIVLGLAVEALKSIKDDVEIGDRGILTSFDLVAIAANKVSSTSNDDNMDMDIDNDLNIRPLPRPSSFIPSSSSSSKTTVQLLPLKKINRSLEVASNLFSNASNWSNNLLPNNTLGSKNLKEIFLPDVSKNFVEMVQDSKKLLERYTPSVKVMEEKVEGEEEEEESRIIESIDREMIKACDQLILDTTLSSKVYSIQSITVDPISSIPNSVNKPFPSKDIPPSLHFSFFKPLSNTNRNATGEIIEEEEEIEDEDEDDFKIKLKPSLKSEGARALLSEWHIGSEPNSYLWSNPYEGEKKKETSDYSNFNNNNRRGKSSKKRNRNGTSPPTSSSFSSSSLPSSQFDSSPTSTQVQSIRPFNNLPTPLRRISTIREEENESYPFETASQPNLSVSFGTSFPSSSSQSDNIFSGGTSQVLPGVFGGRNIDKEKKIKTKKRVSGF